MIDSPHVAYMSPTQCLHVAYMSPTHFLHIQIPDVANSDKTLKEECFGHSFRLKLKSSDQ